MILRILQGSPKRDPDATSALAFALAQDLQPGSLLQGSIIEPPGFAALPAFKTRRSATFSCSVAGHAVAIAAILFLFPPDQETPPRPVLEHYTLRYLQLRAPEPLTRQRAGGSASGAQLAAPGPTAPQATKAVVPGPPAAGTAGTPPVQQTAKAAPRKFELPPVPQKRRVEQTLIQLERPPDLALRADIRVPAVMLWDPRTVARPPVKKFIAPERKQAPKVQRSVLPEPTLEVPNQERNIADINLAAVRVTAVPLLPHPPSSTTPVRVINSGPTGEIPRSAAADEAAQRDAANLISIPDFALPTGKVLAIPPANQVADAHMGPGGDGSGNGTGKSQGQSFGGGASGPGSGASPAGSNGGGTGGGGAGPGGRGSGLTALAGGSGNGTGTGAKGTGTGAGTGPGTGSGPGEGTGGEAGLTGPVIRIVRPKDGHFPAVVMGSAVTGQYPESSGVLSGRLVYTVYVRVGTKKSWIMQYCLPRSVEPAGKVKGSATPVDPPYPFLLLRPELAFTPDMDYVIVHGVVTATGTFEQLSIVGATDFPQEHLLLSSLGLWRFRPASRDGQPTAVEVLLIIPREEV